MSERCINALLDDDGRVHVTFEDKTGTEYQSVELAQAIVATLPVLTAEVERLAIVRDLLEADPTLRKVDAILRRTYEAVPRFRE